MTTEHSHIDDPATDIAGPSENAPTGVHHKGLEHIVVIMFENRSFDTIFGYLYDDENPRDGQPFEGLQGGGYFNDAAETAEKIYTYKYEDKIGFEQAMRSPDPDPGEEYQHVNVQLYGAFNPPSNEIRDTLDMRSPYNVRDDGVINMGGFVLDYFHQINLSDSKEAHEKSKQIMGSFTPKFLPVLSTLAKNFAVYDHWFSAVPSQTFCNRAFFHASTSSGYVTNLGKPMVANWEDRDGIEKWWDRNDVPTIFNRLQDKKKSWAVYYDRDISEHYQPESITRMINLQALEGFDEKNFKSMKEFYDDVENGNLPDYAFIEPRQIFFHNDMHPPLKFEYDGQTESLGYDMRGGEELLSEVYMAIRNSSTDNRATASNAMNTTLLVTFDEHGGTYDHVKTPTATAPEMHYPSECGFKFDRLGLRVPTIAISAYTKAGTVINDQMDHAAVIATLCRRYGLDSLTARDKDALDIGNALNLGENEARKAEDWPVTAPHPILARPEFGPFTGKMALMPLTPPARSLLALVVSKYGESGEKTPENYGEAYEVLQRLGKKPSGQ